MSTRESILERIQREKAAAATIDPGSAALALESAQDALNEARANVVRLERALTEDATAIEAARATNTSALLKGGKASLVAVPPSHAGELNAALEQARAKLPPLESAVRRAEDVLAKANARNREEADRATVAKIAKVVERANADIAELAKQLSAGAFEADSVKVIRVMPVAPSNRSNPGSREIEFVDGAPGRCAVNFSLELEPTPAIPKGVKDCEAIAEARREAIETRREVRDAKQHRAEQKYTNLTKPLRAGVSAVRKL